MDNEEKDIDSEEDVEKKREKRDEIHQWENKQSCRVD
jgi:hypothetical protein